MPYEKLENQLNSYNKEELYYILDIIRNTSTTNAIIKSSQIKKAEESVIDEENGKSEDKNIPYEDQETVTSNLGNTYDNRPVR